MRPSPEKQFRQMQYKLALAREELGIRLKDIPDVTGVGRGAYQSVVYNPGGASILNVIRVAEAFGYELVLRKKEEK